MTEKENILSDITTKLADFSGIVPSKVREVLIRILNYITLNTQVNALNKGSITIGDLGVGSVGLIYTIAGDIVSATLDQRTSKGNVILVTVTNPHSGANYFVDVKTPESLGTMELDNDIRPVIWKKINEDSFYIYLEDTGGIQNLKIHFETKSL